MSGGLDSETLAGLRADIDAALDNGDVPAVAAALQRLAGTPDRPTEDSVQFARQLVDLPEPGRRHLLDRMEVIGAADGHQEAVMNRHRARDADKSAATEPVTLTHGQYSAILSPLTGPGRGSVEIRFFERDRPFGDTLVMSEAQAVTFALDTMAGWLRDEAGWPPERGAAIDLATTLEVLAETEARSETHLEELRRDYGDAAEEMHGEVLKGLQGEVSWARRAAEEALAAPAPDPTDLTAADALRARAAIATMLGDDHDAATRARSDMLDWLLREPQHDEVKETSSRLDETRFASTTPPAQTPEAAQDAHGHPGATAAAALQGPTGPEHGPRTTTSGQQLRPPRAPNARGPATQGPGGPIDSALHQRHTGPSHRGR